MTRALFDRECGIRSWVCVFGSIENTAWNEHSCYRFEAAPLVSSVRVYGVLTPYHVSTAMHGLVSVGTFSPGLVVVLPNKTLHRWFGFGDNSANIL